jgi:hypothetical protein
MRINVTPWIPSPLKTSLHNAALKKVGYFSPPDSLKIACMKLQNKQVSIMDHSGLPYLPWQKKSSKTPGQTELSRSKTEKHK